jgi:uncharacterized membrane protein YebE (DUF533 family)
MDLKKMIGGLTSSGALSGFMGGVAGGGLTSIIASKKGRKVGGSVLKVGALAAVGGLAWKAYQNYSANSQGAQQADSPQQQPQALANNQTQRTPQTFQQEPRQVSSQVSHKGAQFDFAPARIQQKQFEEVVDDNNPNGQMLLMRAMITAAHCDGHIDNDERQRIFAQVGSMDLSVEEKATLFDELRKPLDLASLVSQVPNAQTGIEVYAASASALDLEHQDSQAYLQALANQLCIPSDLTASIQQQIQNY